MSPVCGTVCGEFVEGSGRQTKITPGSRKEPYEAYAGRTLPSFYPRNEQGDDVCGRFSRLFPEMVTET